MKKILLVILTSGMLLLASMGLRGQDIGFVINDGNVKLHVNSDIKSNKIDLLSNEEVVYILDTTKEKVALKDTDDVCNKFPMIKIKNKKGNIGWASGKYIYRILSKEYISKEYINKNVDCNFNMNGHNYRLLFCRNYGIEVSDEEGLTGFQVAYPFIIQDMKDKTYYLVHNIKSSTQVNKYCIIFDEEAFSDKLVSIVKNDKTIILKMKYITITGKGSYEMKFYIKDNMFYGEAYNDKYINTDK